MKLPEPRITAGEWRVGNRVGNEKARACFGHDWGTTEIDTPEPNGCMHYAAIEVNTEDSAEREANARAIAALPNLLAACKQAAERGDKVCEAAYREAVEEC